ncbi:uncharacterized protein A4U43_C04F14310 [Asparagus officinalis]|uniref:Uncharacterized protein n=1 Tax=Asparagus officinalis TaxID=4686 RepID=A0A5P1F656_ASPOF|nr:uncharacterized protein A4U43_C04F14310 [Asparagus officinalis]
MHLLLAEANVKDLVTMESVLADDKTIGEVAYRGNNKISGYMDLKRTEEAFRGGWFHSRDTGVIHHDGYIEFKDREKDMEVYDGRKIGLMEIESMIFGHPAVYVAAVMRMSCVYAEVCTCTHNESVITGRR